MKVYKAVLAAIRGSTIARAQSVWFAQQLHKVQRSLWNKNCNFGKLNAYNKSVYTVVSTVNNVLKRGAKAKSKPEWGQTAVLIDQLLCYWQQAQFNEDKRQKEDSD